MTLKNNLTAFQNYILKLSDINMKNIIKRLNY